MTKRDRLLLQHYSAVPHQRFGNERAWSVTAFVRIERVVEGATEQDITEAI